MCTITCVFRSMRTKVFEGILDSLETFSNPNIKLEQYTTPPYIVSKIFEFVGNIENRTIIDMGCGSGILSFGACLKQCESVLSVDIDENAIKLTDENRSYYQSSFDSTRNIWEILNADISSNFLNNYGKTFDICIMNPPFGTKNNQGLDIKFLEKASHVVTESIFSLHKTSTRSFIQKKCAQYGLEANVLGKFEYQLERTYRFHKNRS